MNLEEEVQKLRARVEELEKSSAKPKKEKVPRKPTEFNTYVKNNLAKVKEENPKLSHKEAFAETAKRYKTSKNT